MRSLSTIVLLLCMHVCSQAAFAKSNVVILPFVNLSGFRHETWSIGKDVPQFLADSLKTDSGFSVRTYQDVESVLKQADAAEFYGSNEDRLNRLAQNLGADLIVHGQILEFEIGRLNLGTSILSGFGHYRVQLKISYQVYERAGEHNSEKRVCESSPKQNEFVAVAAKPDQKTSDYRLLDSLEFAAPLFMQTILGEALQDIRKQFMRQMTLAYSSKSSAADSATDADEYFEAKILIVRPDEVYINVGQSEGIVSGEVYPVYADAAEIREPGSERLLGFTQEQVGKIKVVFVKAAHLSHAKIIDGSGKIKPGDSVRIRKR